MNAHAIADPANGGDMTQNTDDVTTATDNVRTQKLYTFRRLSVYFQFSLYRELIKCAC